MVVEEEGEIEEEEEEEEKKEEEVEEEEEEEKFTNQFHFPHSPFSWLLIAYDSVSWINILASLVKYAMLKLVCNSS